MTVIRAFLQWRIFGLPKRGIDEGRVPVIHNAAEVDYHEQGRVLGGEEAEVAVGMLDAVDLEVLGWGGGVEVHSGRFVVDMVSLGM